MRNGEWSTWVSRDEACARSAGRRRFNSIRKLKARVRQQAILRRLRELGDFTRRGVQRQLAREFGVSASVICRDVGRLFALLDAHPVQARRVSRPRKVPMSQKLSLRVGPTLIKGVQDNARRQGISLSAFVRTVLYQAMGQSTPASAPSALPPNDALEWLVMTLPPEVQQPVRQAVTATELPLGTVLKALIITACQPKMTPQSFENTEALPMTAPLP